MTTTAPPPLPPGALSGLKVLEMGALIVGPFCAKLLGEFGADVVKIEPPGQGDPELWAVHGGGFYHVQMYRVAPAELPAPLHWFKWEAYATWLSGFALFVVLYYANARTYMIDPAVADIAPWQAIAISLALLGVGWLFYDALCKRAGLEREPLIAAVMVGFLTIVAWGLSQVFSGRAMFIQVGAMLGTMMAANVAHVIIPSQRELVRAKERNELPDPVHGRRGKQRSVHNNYFTLPVLFVMISSHYPMTWGHLRRVARAGRDPARRGVRAALLQSAASGPHRVGDSGTRARRDARDRGRDRPLPAVGSGGTAVRARAVDRV